MERQQPRLACLGERRFGFVEECICPVDLTDKLVVIPAILAEWTSLRHLVSDAPRHERETIDNPIAICGYPNSRAGAFGGVIKLLIDFLRLGEATLKIPIYRALGLYDGTCIRIQTLGGGQLGIRL